MKENKKGQILKWLIALAIVLLVGCQNVPVQDAQGKNDTQQNDIDVTEFLEGPEESELAEVDIFVVEEGTYISKEEVAAYLHLYGELPDNFITKKEAKALGWVSTERNLAEVAPGMSIGGDYFGNNEGLLPEEKDRDYYECDINSTDGNRGAERIVYSDDGLIYYTPDHYESFELLYGEE